jgi:hypothetical protein
MSRQGFRKLVANFTILILLSVCLFFVSSPQAAWGSVFWWQSPQKYITHSPQRNQPVRFDKVKIAGKLIELKANSESKEDIEGDDDWMRGLTVSLKNTSDKNIVYVSLVLMFPETTSAGPVMGFPLQFGRMPENADDKNYEGVLKPGEETEIVLTDDKHEHLQTFLKSRSFNKVSNVRLFLGSVVFDDDIQWFGGDLMRRDPKNPGQWHNIR